MVTYGSVCSGIESASVAWESLGFEPQWFSEIEPFPCAVLAHHWPHVGNLGDMSLLPSMVRAGFCEAPQILVGGTPCQAFSVAGKQGSLTDERGGLSLIYGDLLNAIDEKRPGDEAVAVWENVPGVLSTKDNAFGHLLGLLAGEFTLADCLGGRAEPLEAQPCASRQKWPKSGCVIGPKRTVAWRVIDAQYFGLAQRRKRVFVVASARDGFDPAAVLFEREGVRRDIAPSRETQPPVAAITANGVGKCGADDNQAQAGHLIAHRMIAFGEYAQDNAASTIKSRDYKDATDLVVHGTQDPCVSDNLAFALGRNNGGENVIAGFKAGQGSKAGGIGFEEEISPTLTASDSGTQQSPGLLSHEKVRRLTPIECERLQGFPDNHTHIPYRNRLADQCPDGPRYKAIGNSKAVLCVRWIGIRILQELYK